VFEGVLEVVERDLVERSEFIEEATESPPEVGLRGGRLALWEPRETPVCVSGSLREWRREPRRTG